MPEAPELPLFLTVNDLAHLLHVEPSTIRWRRYVGQPLPPVTKVGRRVLFARDDVLAWLQELREPATS